MSVPRQYFQDLPWKPLQSEVQVIAFGDASEVAYGAVIYLRIKRGEGYQVTLTASRSRVAPLSGLTLPRLELLASLMTARLAKTVCDELDIPYSQVKFYSDSEIVLHWINSKSYEFKTFISNRVAEIQRLSTPAQWQHCSGISNPADIASRGLPGDELASSEMWVHGPMWLQKYENDPNSDRLTIVPENTNLERKGHVLISVEAVHESNFSFTRIGKLNKAINALAYIYRVINNCKLPRSEWLRGPLAAEEMASATTHLWRLQQQSAFKQESECLTQGKNLPKGSALTRLNPFLCDQGLLRVGGRLKNAALPYNEKYPIILPRCHIATLLIRNQHERSRHAGVDTLITQLSRTFHVISIRPISKSIIKYCTTCQRFDKKACNQVAPPLPGYRVNPARPFDNIGIDFAGPLFAKGSAKKYYFLIFVCSVVRAIHIELTSGINLSELKLAFRRFCSRRGLPSLVVSDNATTFAAAARQMTSWYGPQAPKWNHIAPRAPWWGGLYERHIKSVKASLKKSIGRCRLTSKEIEAILIDIEGIINQRPLVKGENQQLLAPVDFIRPHFTGEGRNQSISLNQIYINQQNALKEFWTIWSSLYLKTLAKVVPQHKEKFPLQLGDIVIVDNENISTNKISWPLGKVIEILESSDQRVRTVKVLTERGTYIRPVQRLILLEMTKNPSS